MTNDRLTLEGATCVSCNSTTEDGRTTYSCDPTTLKLDRYIALTFIQKDQLVAYSLATWPIDRFTPPVLPPNPYERIVFIIHEYNDKFAFTFFLKSEPISLNYKSENETLIISDDSEKVMLMMLMLLMLMMLMLLMLLMMMMICSTLGEAKSTKGDP